MNYFAAVRVWRHILRIEAWQGAPLQNAAQIVRAVARFHFRVAPITALALLGMIPTLWLWPRLAGDSLALGTGYLVLISALTLPHALAVAWLDVRDRR